MNEQPDKASSWADSPIHDMIREAGVDSYPSTGATMMCDICGREFPADSHACVDSGIVVEQTPDDGEEWKGEFIPIDPATFCPDERKRIMASMELDDAEFDELLLTGKIGGLGAIICLECQDELINTP